MRDTERNRGASEVIKRKKRKGFYICMDRFQIFSQDICPSLPRNLWGKKQGEGNLERSTKVMACTTKGKGVVVGED
ncbi:hypothetical protein QN277_005975 [Acacia crassicarpa]|uniref:Uncharacterized protein n=1 Tax=Acacia crassicarpa TaxID=499986 RepID=A0AAE1IZ30_9FABA|nr:hypothetical protein QN277_005975 [Acacia crassicarpa]